MKNNSERSLKSLNMKWLVLLGIADLLVLLAFVAPELLNGATFTQISIGRIVASTVIPVAVLLAVNVLPHDVKSVLVYWKPRGVLPGHEAFSKYGPGDSRIDLTALKKNVGVLPTEPAEQNSKWYKLYKLVPNEPEVAEAHKLFLMYRDMAVMSIALLILAPLSLRLAGASTQAAWLAVAVFAAQYLVTAISARWSGIRFVCNVLAVHSARKVSATKSVSAGQPST